MNYIKRLIEILKYGKYGRKKFYLYDETDPNNFGSDAVYKPVKEDLVNQTFIVFNPTPLDQYDSDFCVGFGGAYIAEATERIICSGAYLFAMAKKLTGDWTGWGTSILQRCKARQKFGVCKKELWDYQNGRRDFYANWNNIPQEAREDASNHKSQSYFQIIKPYGWDMFDTLRAYLWHFKDQKMLIDTGNNGHNITVIGYDSGRNALICRDSYGTRTYDEGIRYIYRNEANGLFTPYMELDMERSLAELLVAYNGKAIKIAGDPTCYLVKDGKKHLLEIEPMGWANNTLLFSPDFVFEILKDDFDKIPTGDTAKYTSGEYWKIVKRFFELTPEQFNEYKNKVNEAINKELG